MRPSSIILFLCHVVACTTAFTVRQRPVATANSRPITPSATPPPPTSTTRLAATSVTQQNCDIAIFGGGFGGLYTALNIASRSSSRNRNRPLDIVLVDPSDRFVFLPLLYDLVAGSATRQEVCPPYKDLLRGLNIRFVQGDLQDIITTAKGSLGATVQDALNSTNSYQLTFQEGIIAVGATPQSILQKVPGAATWAQPFYTQEHALETRSLLEKLQRKTSPLNIAVVGGGYGGVELAACLQRRFGSQGKVTLLASSPPLQGTRAQAVVQPALEKLGVKVEICRVNAIEPIPTDKPDPFAPPQVRVLRSQLQHDGNGETIASTSNDQIWDAVFWTAGSGPAEPVANPQALTELERVQGRLATDRSLRCYYKGASPTQPKPALWALGDCAQVIGGSPTPKTAQAAMQQADVVAYNVLLHHGGASTVASRNSRRMTRSAPRTFTYQDLGSMLILGGANGVIAAPPDSSTLGPVFAPLLDTARFGLGVADSMLKELAQSRENSSASALANLSLGGYGLGVQDDKARGSLAGTLAGGLRRAVYAARMPTNRQRAYSAASAALSTVLTLAKEASESASRGQDSNKQM